VETDRGRFWHPARKAEPGARSSQRTRFTLPELWFYNNPEFSTWPPAFFHLLSSDGGVGEFELYSPLNDGPQALLTGFQQPVNDFRDDIERAYNKLYAIDVELAKASISFRTDEGDTAQFQNPSFGTIALLDDIADVPFYHLDTSYAERLDFERGNVESDYLFTYVPSFGIARAPRTWACLLPSLEHRARRGERGIRA
jgi:hypothetical protein